MMAVVGLVTAMSECRRETRHHACTSLASLGTWMWSSTCASAEGKSCGKSRKTVGTSHTVLRMHFLLWMLPRNVASTMVLSTCRRSWVLLRGNAPTSVGGVGAGADVDTHVRV